MLLHDRTERTAFNLAGQRLQREERCSRGEYIIVLMIIEPGVAVTRGGKRGVEAELREHALAL